MAWRVFDKARGEHPSDIGSSGCIDLAVRHLSGIDKDLTKYELDEMETGQTLSFRRGTPGVIDYRSDFRPLTRAVPDDAVAA